MKLAPIQASLKLALIFLFLVCPGIQGDPENGFKLKVDIMLAGEKKAGIDSRLEGLFKSMPKELHLHSLRLVSSQTLLARPAKECQVSMPENGLLVLNPLSTNAGKRVSLKLSCKGPRNFETLLYLDNQASFLFKGPTTLEGEIIVSVTLV